jgi:hypothetical protein
LFASLIRLSPTVTSRREGSMKMSPTRRGPSRRESRRRSTARILAATSG